MTYIAGWNMPGYMPESEPEEFDTAREAVQYLLDTVERFWDSDADVPNLEADARWLGIHTALHNALTSTEDLEDFAGDTGDMSLVFWIERSEEES